MNKFNDYLTVQKGLNDELQRKAKGKDILFLLFCVIFPFFTDNIFFNIIIFSGIGFTYIKFGIINLSSDYQFQNDINTQTKNKIYNK